VGGKGGILKSTFQHNTGCHSPHIPIKERNVSRRQPHDRARARLNRRPAAAR